MAELLRLLPGVLRARDFHLYLEGGKRITDLWLAGGKAVLGHKPPRVLSELKNAAERGLFGPLPHPAEKRFIRALGEFFPGRAFRLYADENSLGRALDKAGFGGEEWRTCGSEKISLWRPFMEHNGGGDIPVLVPVLPFGPAALALDKSAEPSFPPGDLLPPVLLAPAIRALYDLAAALKNFVPDKPMYPKIEKVLAKGGRQRQWLRRGIYLTAEPAVEGEQYEALFRYFLEGDFLIPPSPREPLILPLSMSSGEEAKLARLLES